MNRREFVTACAVGAAAVATTGPATRMRLGDGGRYDTNSFILAYPEMAKTYGLQA